MEKILGLLQVDQSTVAMVEHFGRFVKALDPGCHCVPWCCCYRPAGLMSLRVRQLDVRCETKTKDNVFVTVVASIQYQAIREQIEDAFYKLQDPQAQIRSYVFDVVRASVPKMDLDRVFEVKNEIAHTVEEELEKAMRTYGYRIVQTLIVDVEPDHRVKAAMNEINAAQRIRMATQEKAEAEKILQVKKAEGEAEARYLSGVGVARQRQAIVEGLRDSVLGFSEQVPGTTPKDVLDMVMLTQYFDTMRDIGANNRSSTIFVPHGPGAAADIAAQIRNGMLHSNVAARTNALTDLGERPRSPPVLFADNRLADLLCEEPRLVGKAKRIQLCYFLLREFQQRGQAHVVRVVSEANTADFFTKTLSPCAHQQSNHTRVASPTVTRLLATVVTYPGFESTAAFALVTELPDFAARSRLNYVASLVTESDSVCPPSDMGEPALGSDVLEDRQFELECLATSLPCFASMLLCPEGDPDALDIPTPRSYAEAITCEYSSQWQTAMDAEMASWKSTGTYVDKVPPPGANIVEGMWIFRVKRPPGSPPAFKARYAQQDYELHSLELSTTFLQGSLYEEIWLRRPPGFTGSFPAGTQWSLRWPVYGLRPAPREWHDTLRTTLAALGFAPSTADPTLFLRTDITLPPFYVLVARRTITLNLSHIVHQVLQRFGFQCSSPQPTPLPTGHLLLAPPSDKSVEPSGPYPELVGFLITSGMGLVLGGQGSVELTGHSDASWADDQVTQRLPQGYTFSLVSGSVSWRSTRSSSVLGSSCEAEIYAGAMAAQELRWLTYLLGGAASFSSSSLQQRGQLRLSYEASRAKTADVFTKALESGDHQRFCTTLGLLSVLNHLLFS
ncbi:unnamed protein product [Closterium sp. NIES-53]